MSTTDIPRSEVPEPDTRTTTEKEADDNAEAARAEIINIDEPLSDEDKELYGGAFVEAALIDIPEVTVRRGGMAFSGGWCGPSDLLYSMEPRDLDTWSKKRLRKELLKVEKRLTEERNLRWKVQGRLTKAQKKIRRLSKIIGRIV